MDIRRHLKTAIFAFLAVVVLAAGILPPCGMEGCCATGEVSMHMQMPCCDEPNLAPRDAVRVVAAPASASVPPPQSSVVATVIVPAAIAPVAPRVHATVAAV